jgi:hypothetical protein
MKIFFLTIVCFIASYYIAILLHEWGHGAAAWLFGYKVSPFDVQYGGWFLLQTDEHVPYKQILSSGHGTAAALIGIAGISVSTVLFVLSLWALNTIRSSWLYSFFYWFAVMNMVPMIQYFTVQTFSIEGDVGRFIYGLEISPWWVFIPGTLIVCLGLFVLLTRQIPKAFALIPIHSLWAQRLFLLFSLFVMFLMIYTHGYNPLSDEGMPSFGKVLAIVSIIVVPVLFFLCNPSCAWVKGEIERQGRKFFS